MSTKSSKNELQEFCTQNKWDYPFYELISANQEFTVRVTVLLCDGSEVTAEASDSKKKGAEKEAARLALSKLRGATPALADAPSNPAMDIVPEDSDVRQIASINGAEAPNQQSLLGSQKNYRSKLHEFCQHHGYKIKFSSGEIIETPEAPRFSVMLSVDNRNVSGGGGSKKEANEDAAKRMWDIINPENQSPSNTSKMKHPYIIQHTPFTMGIQPQYQNEIMIDGEPNSEIDCQLTASKMNTAQFVSSSHSHSDVNNHIKTDRVAELRQLLRDNNPELEIAFIEIPTEGLLTDSVYLFVHLFTQGAGTPAYTGHGSGATEEDARNAAVRNLMLLMPDSFNL